MKRVFERFFLALAILLTVGIANGAQAQTQPRMKVVVYGDGLTSGYQLQADDSYANKLYRKLQEIGFDNVQVINMSVANETTSNAATERLSSLINQRPDIVIVQLGSNDVQRGISTNLIYHNLVSILSELQKNKAYVVLMGVKAPEALGYTYGAQLAEGYSRIAKFYKAALYPNILEEVTGHSELTLADGVHPNAKGMDVIVESTYRLVDAGLRWKIELIAYQQKYKDQIKETPVIPRPPPL